MKKVITTIALVLSIVALTNAQIKKPKVKVNTTPIETNTKLQGVKVNNLNRLKTIADFEKLNIPVQQMTKEKLHAKPTQTWKINPRIINDGVLKFERLDGWITTNSWNFGRGPERTIREDVERLNSGRSAGGVFDLKIEFKVIGGIEYRLKLKEIDPWGIYQDKYLFVSRSSSNGLYISRINMNELNEFNYIFSEPKSCDIKLGFTGTAHVDPSVEDYKWFPVTIAEVRIDRLN